MPLSATSTVSSTPSTRQAACSRRLFILAILGIVLLVSMSIMTSIHKVTTIPYYLKGSDIEELDSLRARVRVLEDLLHSQSGSNHDIHPSLRVTTPSTTPQRSLVSALLLSSSRGNSDLIQYIPSLVHYDRLDYYTRTDNTLLPASLCKGITLRVASIIPPRAVLYNEDGILLQQKIPRIIWQTYKTSRMPDRMAHNTFNWAGMNPEYAYRFFDDDLVKEYLLTTDALPVSTSDMKDALQQLPSMFHNGAGVAMADIWRLAVLYEYGGVYADVDSIIVNPLRRWVDSNATIITSIESGRFIAQYVMMFRPKHPVTEVVNKEAIRLAVRNIINKTPSSLAKFPNTLEAYTGPAVVKEAFDTWLSAHHQQLMPSDKPIIIGQDIVRVFEDVGFSGNVKFKDGKYHADLKKCNQGHWLYGWYRSSSSNKVKG